MLCASPSYASDQVNKIKAVFLFKFFDYVSWPTADEDDKTLCTYGPHPFGKNLSYIAKMQNGGNTKVISIPSLDQAGKCNVLYIHDNTSKKQLSNTSMKNTLIVSSSNDSLENGGVISMVEKSGRIRLYINLKEAEKKKLKISSRLLDIAEVLR